MIKIILNGCFGKMGRIIIEASSQFPNIQIIGGINRSLSYATFPVFKSIEDVNVEYDVLLDFSRPEALVDLLSLTGKTKKPLVICSTGHSAEDLALIKEKSGTLPLFKSANMSLGINLINSLLKKVAPLLYGNYDIEIVEKHHNQKVDAPSGTALLLADTIKDSLAEETVYVNGRDGQAKREKNEIGIHAVRGGSLVGDHDIIFAGSGEIIELSHRAFSREIYAIGALKACEFMGTVTEAGLYNMDDVIDF